jgi:hypothetical protein
LRIKMQKIVYSPKYGGLFVLFILILTLATLNIPRAYADAVTWTGSAGDGKWESAKNWSSRGIPGASDLVSISGPFTVSLSSTAGISGLSLAAGSVLNCNSGCSLTLGTGGTTIYGAINVNFGGTISNFDAIDNSGTITNNQGGTISNSGTINNYFGSAIVNSGTITNHRGATITNPGYTSNQGTIINECGGTISGSGTVSGKPVYSMNC